MAEHFFQVGGLTSDFNWRGGGAEDTLLLGKIGG